MTSTESQHPAASIEQIIINSEDVIQAIQRNARDKTEPRKHVLRVSPPFEGEKEATLYVSEEQNYYPPDMDPKPLHISPEAVLAKHSMGTHHSNFEDHWRYPSRQDEFSKFQRDHDEIDIDEWDRYDEATKEEFQEQFDEEWWEVAINTWRENVENQLSSVSEITFDWRAPSLETVAIPVQVKDGKL